MLSYGFCIILDFFPFVIYLSIYISIYLSSYLSSYLPIYHLSIYLYIYLSFQVCYRCGGCPRRAWWTGSSRRCPTSGATGSFSTRQSPSAASPSRYRGIHEKGSRDVGKAVCVQRDRQILYTVQQTAETSPDIQGLYQLICRVHQNKKQQQKFTFKSEKNCIAIYIFVKQS